MIRVGMISEMSESSGENWMIVRSPDSILTYAKHVPELSPSPELFRIYREAYHKGEFDQKFFLDVYVPRFIKELAQNKAALDMLDYLCCKSKENDYYLGCYCSDESLCHRSIIAGLLIGLGAYIDTNPEYIKYYKMFEKGFL